MGLKRQANSIKVRLRDQPKRGCMRSIAVPDLYRNWHEHLRPLIADVCDSRLTVYPKDTEFMPKRAVNASMRKTDEWYYVIYVGHGNLEERPSPIHPKWDSINKEGVTHIAILGEENEAKRREIVTDMRNQFHPRCNAGLNSD